MSDTFHRPLSAFMLLFSLVLLNSPRADAQAIGPEGSLTIGLQNFANGQPYFVYSSNGGAAPVYNTTTQTVTTPGVAGFMTQGATVTIMGQRYVFSTGTLNGVDNLGIRIGDQQALISSGIYPDGNYTDPANLVISIDGLRFDFNTVTAQYIPVGNGAFQDDNFTGIMEAGTNSVTGQQFLAGDATLLLSLNQSNVAGGSTIGYTVTLNVQPKVPEPSTMAIFGSALAMLGRLTRRRRGC